MPDRVSDLARDVAAMRRFNRLYTRRIGLLEEHFLHSPFSLTEARVLYEIAHGQRPSAKEIGKTLKLDAGYLSRILRRFARDGLIRRETSPDDARLAFITLTKKGARAFAPIDSNSQAEAAAVLKSLGKGGRSRAASAMRTLTALLDRENSSPSVNLRKHRPGDLGWIVSRHGALYAQEYGWNEKFEGLVAEIVAEFVRGHDEKRARCWIAELNGEPVGSVAVVGADRETAKLRLLLVEPEARGFGLGKKLVDECIRFARAAGYRKITLWAQSILVAARGIYERAGFRKVREEPHALFGTKLMGETWDLEL
jgi:DNA-binding MarR family transcriptional regulator/GNAT superfamily N-acetyltransferase